MNTPEQQYLDLLRNLITYGDEREGRNGLVRSLFAHQLRFDLSKGFPLLTTKKVHLKSVIAELLWMLSGDTNVRALQAQGVTIWDEWADAAGDLGPVYGKQWRSWSGRVTGAQPTFTHTEGDLACGVVDIERESFDQIANVVRSLRENPYDRGHIVSAWNPAELDDMALRPCHCLFQFYVTTAGRLDLQIYQRSADAFLGLPFNIASYALLTMMMAKVLGLTPGRFTHTLGDVHIYNDHFSAARQQLQRVPTAFPTMTLASRTSIDGWQIGDFTLSDYHPSPAIPAPVSK